MDLSIFVDLRCRRFRRMKRVATYMWIATPSWLAMIGIFQGLLKCASRDNDILYATLMLNSFYNNI